MTSRRASDIVGERLKEIRQRRGITASDLANRCADIGAPEITRAVIANIESGRRDISGRRRRNVTVDELDILAYVLDVPPVLLMVPLDGNERLQITGTVEMDVLEAVGWVDQVTDEQTDARPLGLLRRIVHDVRWAERTRQANLDQGTPENIPVLLGKMGQSTKLFSEWLESLGYARPPLPKFYVDAMQDGDDE